MFDITTPKTGVDNPKDYTNTGTESKETVQKNKVSLTKNCQIPPTLSGDSP